MMGFASMRKSDGSLIEYQSAGTTEALLTNALSAGFAVSDVEIVPMTDADLRVIVAAQQAAALTYADKRRAAYPPVGNQLDALWHAMDIGTLVKIEPFYSDNKAVKATYPKP